MKNLLLTGAMLLFGYAVNAQDAHKLLSNYLLVKDALVSGDNKASSKAVADFVEAVNAEGNFEQKKNLLKATQAMNKSGDIEKQRASFENVSTIMWGIVKQAAPLGQDVYYQYCPMKKAYWLSNEATIKNPYYGAKMLTCGSVKDKKLK